VFHNGRAAFVCTKQQKTLNLQLPSGQSKSIDINLYHKLLLGGDQLTAARARGSCAARCDHEASQRLNGLIPVTEDWHAKMCYLKII